MRRKPGHLHLRVPSPCMPAHKACTRTDRPLCRTGGMGSFGCAIRYPRSGDAPRLANERCCGSRTCSGRRPQLAGGSGNRGRRGTGYNGIGRDCINDQNATTGWDHVDHRCADFGCHRSTKQRIDERLESCSAQFGRRVRVARRSAGNHVYQPLPMLLVRIHIENLYSAHGTSQSIGTRQ